MIGLVDDTTFLSHDLQLLESLEFKQRIKHVVEIIEEVKWEEIDPDMLTRFVLFCSSMCSLLASQMLIVNTCLLLLKKA